MTHRGQPEAAIRGGKQFCFNHPGPVCQREEFHSLAGDLMVRALLYHQPTRNHFRANALWA